MKRYISIFVSLVLLAAAFVYADAAYEGHQRARSEAARNAAILGLLDGSKFVGREGAAEAADDILKGHPRWITYGRGAENGIRDKLVFQRFGIAVDPIAGCLVGQPVIAYAQSYNRVIEKYVTKQFGPSAFNALNEEASELRKAELVEKKG